LRYHLTAFLHSTDSKVRKSKKEIQVNKLMTGIIVGVESSVAAEMKSCCCFSKGVLRLSAQLNKNAYVPGERVEVQADVDNSQSLIAVRGVRAVLQRTIRLRDDRGRTAVFKDNLNEGFSRLHTPAGAKTSEHHALNLAVAEANSAPQNATSYSGRCIECLYQVTISADVDGMCMCGGQAPEVRKDVVVYPMQMVPAMAVLQAPEGWHPAVMPLAQFIAAHQAI
jgi:hypothetical protein